MEQATDDLSILSREPQRAADVPVRAKEVMTPELREPKVKIRPPSWALRLGKRAFDLAFVLVFFALFWWVFIIVAAGIAWTSPGPLVFGHTRVGRFGRRFKCYKFRSMVVNSAEVLEQVLANDPAARQEWETSFKLKNDPRITKFGNFIRKTSLDELPQLWNIFRGDMSVVGPRPVTREELQRYYGRTTRHYISVRPGLTGPWQVNGRSDTTYAERVDMDREYVESWSIGGDLVIVLKTAAVVFKSQGAY